MNYERKALIMKKKIISLLVVILLLTTSLPAFATNSVSAEAVEQSEANEAVQSRIYWNGSAYLQSGLFCTIVGSNNLFGDAPLVTSNANNPGTVMLRVVNGSGAVVGNIKRVAPGESVRLDTIPATSGTYTIQGRTAVSGTYSFVIN